LPLLKFQPSYHSDVNVFQEVYPKNSADLTFLILPMLSTWPVLRKWCCPKCTSLCDVMNCLFNTYYVSKYFPKIFFQLCVIISYFIASDHIVHPSVNITFLIFSVLETKHGDVVFEIGSDPSLQNILSLNFITNLISVCSTVAGYLKWETSSDDWCSYS